MTNLKEKCCNLCGNPLDEMDLQNDFTIHKKIGYGSVHDTGEVELRFCCKCFDTLVAQCTKDPITEDPFSEDEEKLLLEYQRAGVC